MRQQNYYPLSWIKWLNWQALLVWHSLSVAVKKLALNCIGIYNHPSDINRLSLLIMLKEVWMNIKIIFNNYFTTILRFWVVSFIFHLRWIETYNEFIFWFSFFFMYFLYHWAFFTCKELLYWSYARHKNIVRSNLSRPSNILV